MSRPSRLSDNDKGDTEIVPGAMYRSPGICLMAVGDRQMKVLRPVIASNGVTYLQMRSLDRTARQEGRRKGREGSFSLAIY